MLSHEEFYNLRYAQEVEGKIISSIAEKYNLLLSEGLRIYLEHPELMNYIFDYDYYAQESEPDQVVEYIMTHFDI